MAIPPQSSFKNANLYAILGGYKFSEKIRLRVIWTFYS